MTYKLTELDEMISEITEIIKIIELDRDAIVYDKIMGMLGDGIGDVYVNVDRLESMNLRFKNRIHYLVRLKLSLEKMRANIQELPG